MTCLIFLLHCDQLETSIFVHVQFPSSLIIERHDRKQYTSFPRSKTVLESGISRVCPQESCDDCDSIRVVPGVTSQSESDLNIMGNHCAYSASHLNDQLELMGCDVDR